MAKLANASDLKSDSLEEISDSLEKISIWTPEDSSFWFSRMKEYTQAYEKQKAKHFSALLKKATCDFCGKTLAETVLALSLTSDGKFTCEDEKCQIAKKLGQ